MTALQTTRDPEVTFQETSDDNWTVFLDGEFAGDIRRDPWAPNRFSVYSASGRPTHFDMFQKAVDFCADRARQAQAMKAEADEWHRQNEAYRRAKEEAPFVTMSRAERDRCLEHLDGERSRLSYRGSHTSASARAERINRQVAAIKRINEREDAAHLQAAE